MLDKRCLALLDVINKQCENTNYKVFEVEDLISLMPAYFGIDGGAINECITSLCEHEYISVKYQDDFEVCLAPLTKGRLVFENRNDEREEKARAEKRYFLYSFLGSAFGGGAVILLALIFLLIFGRI